MPNTLPRSVDYSLLMAARMAAAKNRMREIQKTEQSDVCHPARFYYDYLRLILDKKTYLLLFLPFSDGMCYFCARPSVTQGLYFSTTRGGYIIVTCPMSSTLYLRFFAS